MNRWLGRPPKTGDEVRRLQFCCDKPNQCSYCPFRAENAGVPLKELATRQLRDAWED